MGTLTFSAERVIDHLEQAGMPLAQAIAVLQAQQDAMAQAAAHLATKADIERLALASRADINRLIMVNRADFARLEARLGARVEQRLRTMAWQVTVVWGILLAVALPITVALIKLL